MTRILLALFIFLPLVARAAPLEKPIFAEIYLKGGNDKLSGNVTNWDSSGFTLRAGIEDRNIKWPDLTAASAFTLRSRLIDKSSATDWLDLGTMTWRMGLEKQARSALATAVRMDPTLKESADKIVATPTSRPSALQRSNGAPVKYVKSTPEQDAAAILHAQKVAAAVSAAMKINFVEVQTSHFIVFTDWNTLEHSFLKTNIEQAYNAVSRQFDISAKENVFVGKLPVFMFDKQRDFIRYAQQFDDLPAGPGLLGYYAAHGDGTGHMAMWKPRVQIAAAQGKTPEEQWAYTLTHEFTHAFIDRYKSNRHIPRWLNEGVAEVIAQGEFPQRNRRVLAREMAQNDAPIDLVFDDENMPGGEYYPVMQTMVQMLIEQDRKSFLKYFDAIKDGEKSEAALKRIFKVDYDGLTKAWRKWIAS